MIDMQGAEDRRQWPIDKVGVSGLRYPIVVLDKARERQQTVATLAMSVSLPQEFKGTHMSRFIEVLNEHKGEVTMRTMPTLLADLRKRLSAEHAQVEVNFTYFLERAAPVSGAKGLMDYDCWFKGIASGTGDDFVLGIRVPVTSLCPCSKAISDYGAHNQRGYVSMDVRAKNDLIWLEELVEVAEASASAPVYPLLKRADERHVTMQAYDNPVFVEDMVRNVATRLRDDRRVSWFHVRAENHESIHNHAAFAQIEWARPAQ